MIQRLVPLLIGTGLTSLANFWLYVVVAASDTTGGFAQFVQSNYLGGLYLFGVAGSVGTVAMYAFRSGSSLRVLRQYGLMCAAVVVSLMVVCTLTEHPAGALLCLASALCMQTAGLMIAGLIEADRSLAVSLLPPLHPLIFWVALMGLPDNGPLKWVWCYTIASVAMCVLFVIVGWRPLQGLLQESSDATEIRLKDVLGRMLLAVSFGAVLQLDIVVAGTSRHLDVARFAILQKMYASVATALSGATVQMVIARTANRFRSARGAWMLSLAAVAGGGAVIVCGVLLWLQPHFTLSRSDVVMIALVALLYYWSAFANTWATVQWPRTSSIAMLIGALSYAIVLALEAFSGVSTHAVLPILVFFLIYAMIVTWRAWREDK